MRGKDEQQLDVFSYVNPEQRVSQDHPLRPLRVMTDEALRELQPQFHKLYAKTGRPSIARSVASGTRTCGTIPTVPKVFTSTGWDMRERT
jgi:hypothetical protein